MPTTEKPKQTFTNTAPNPQTSVGPGSGYSVQTLFTIKQAARLVGVTEATLRTWERRYGVVSPERTDTGYRLYDPAAIAALTGMRRLIDAGWSTSTAARAIMVGDVPLDQDTPPSAANAAASTATLCREEFLAAASRLDARDMEACLDRGFSIGSFEYAVDAWLFPALEALGEAWARGEIDIAAEHMASHQVLRRLSAAFEAAGTRTRGPKVVIGLPGGSLHELGALAFATAARRLGLDVLYLGPNVPEQSWLTAVRGHTADAAVLSVVTTADHPHARQIVRSLKAHHPDLLIASGGSHATSLGPHAHQLPHSIADAAQALDALLHR
jgi:MerR family transcriptional regulator, light-induced transcriptional regulator